MTTKFDKEWLIAALVRAAKTFAQTALGMITVGAAFSDLDLIKAASVSGVAALVSILTSVATGLPEAGSDGTIDPLTGVVTLANAPSADANTARMARGAAQIPVVSSDKKVLNLRVGS
jgi:hypothetical protein